MALIKHVGVLKMAYYMGLFGVFMGFIFAVLSLIFTSILSAIGLQVSTFGGLSLLTSGVLSLLILPILYGGISFLMGLIFTPIMNLILKIIGGLELDIVMK